MSTDESPAVAGAVDHADPPLVRCVGLLLDGRDSSLCVEPEQGITPDLTYRVGVSHLSWPSAENSEESHYKELQGRFDPTPEDGTVFIKAERVVVSVKDGNFFEAVKKMKMGDVVVLTVKPRECVLWDMPHLVVDGEVELVSWVNKCAAEDADDEDDDYPSDGALEEEDDFMPKTRAERRMMEKRYMLSLRRFKEDCRKAIEDEKVAKEAWLKDFGNWFSKRIRGEVSIDWRESYCENAGLYYEALRRT